MTRQLGRSEAVRQILAEIDPDIVLADGFDQALLGLIDTHAGLVAVYSRSRCLDVLQSEHSMTWEEAEEYFSFNVESAYVGERTPRYLSTLDELFQVAG